VELAVVAKKAVEVAASNAAFAAYKFVDVALVVVAFVITAFDAVRPVVDAVPETVRLPVMVVDASEVAPLTENEEAPIELSDIEALLIVPPVMSVLVIVPRAHVESLISTLASVSMRWVCATCWYTFWMEGALLCGAAMENILLESLLSSSFSRLLRSSSVIPPAATTRVVSTTLSTTGLFITVCPLTPGALDGVGRCAVWAVTPAGRDVPAAAG